MPNVFDIVDSSSPQPNGNPAKPKNVFDIVDQNYGSSLKDTAKDSAISLGKGVLGLPGMVTGLADIAPALAVNSKPFDAATDYIGKATGFRPGEWTKSLDQ